MHDEKQEAGSYLLRLFVTGTTLRSRQAIESLKAICEDHLQGRYKLEVIDVYQQPELARKEQLVALPTLIKQLPEPFRKLTIEPGGIVPWHSHDDRPALIFVQQGEIVEYASNCADPIVHKAGDLRPEVFGTSHWWKNLGKETVILYVGDVRKDPHDHNM